MDSTTIGQKIKYLRDVHWPRLHGSKMSQAELGMKAFGFKKSKAQTRINHIETGYRKNISKEEITSMLKALEITHTEFNSLIPPSEVPDKPFEVSARILERLPLLKEQLVMLDSMLKIKPDRIDGILLTLGDYFHTEVSEVKESNGIKAATSCQRKVFKGIKDL